MADEKSFLLPDLGEGLADAELLSWRVAVGDVVELNQVIAEVETAKAAVELPSPYAGRVLELQVQEGTTVAVGTSIITFAVESGLAAEPIVQPTEPVAKRWAQHPADAVAERPAAGGAERTAEPVAQRPVEPAPERVPVLVGYGATSGTSSRRLGRAVPPPAARAAVVPRAVLPASDLAGPPPNASAPPPAQRRPLAKPLVRKLARDLGVDLATIPGSGEGGVVTRQNVLDHAAAPPTHQPGHQRAVLPATSPSVQPATSPVVQPASTTAGPTDREERIPIRGVRKATAQAMVRSAFTAPHVTEFITIDVTPTMELLGRLRASAFTDGVKLTPLTFAAKAMLSALQRHPTLNSSWDEAAQEIVLKHYVNLGIATATPRGLMVPNLKDAGGLGLIELARALETLTATAREGRSTPSDLTGGTISLTNVGVFGVDTGTPIINPGEAAILCLGAVRQQPWVHEGALAIRSVTTLSLSFDHRLVDGEQGSRFLADVAGALATG